jgi:spermidine/putrescine transport system permease protein
VSVAIAAAAADRRRAQDERRRRLVAVAQLTPALVYFGLFFIGPFVALFALSFFTFSRFDFLPILTLNNYVSVVTSDTFQTLYLRTIGLSLLASVIVIAIAYPFTYALTFVFPTRRQLLYFLVLVSLFGGYLVRIYAWRSILGAEGVINGTLLSLGIIDEPIRAILNSPFAVVVALVNFLVPLAVLPIYAAMQNVSPGLLEAARDLGSGPVATSRWVVLPLVMPGVRVAFIFTFIAAAGEFAIPSLLGGTETQFVGNHIQFQIGQTLNWPLGAAMAITLIVSAVGISSLLAASTRWLIR